MDLTTHRGLHVSKKITCNSGNPNFWFDQELLTPKTYIKNDITLQLQSSFLQEWQLEVYRNRKCIAYRIFKDDIICEPYLAELDFINRRALCKFRTGNHRLPVAKSRITPEGVGEEAKCRLCDSTDICDEFHVLFICKYFDNDRKKYL